MSYKFFILIMILVVVNQLSAQSNDFSEITQMLNDSSALYLNRIYIEVFKNDSSIYQYQAGWLQCNNIRLGQGSATKWLSSAIFLKLCEQGWLNLDDSIGTYLPLFTQNGKGHITLRQSYSMSSGMFNPTNQNDYHTDPSLTLEQSADSIAKKVEILYPTGTMIGYDGSMMHAWGRAVEVIDNANGNNRSWRTIAKEEFLDLLEMDSTDYTYFYPNNPAVAGGIETTPCDYLKFLKMLANNGVYNGATILQQSSIDEMFIDQTNSAPIYHTYWPSNHPDFPNGLDTMRYTFGAWWLEKDVNNNIIGITSPGVFGHYPFYDRCRNIYGTFFCYIPIQYGSGLKMINTYLRFLKILREKIGPCDLTSVENTIFNMPKEYYLFQNFPNPFNPITTIKFLIPQTEFVTLKLFNILGEEVTTIINNEMNSGVHSVQFNSSKLASGVYYYQLKTDNFSKNLKLVVIK